MLDLEQWQLAAGWMRTEGLTPEQAFSRLLDQKPYTERMAKFLRQYGEIDARVLFFRTLYRFYVPSVDVRQAYLDLLKSPLTELGLLAYAGDAIDHGEPQVALDAITQRLNVLNDRWTKSALFQLVRIGVLFDDYADRCLPYALRLRVLLEFEFDTDAKNDRSTKYAICNLFITRYYLRKLRGQTDSDLIKDAERRIENEISNILENKDYWDAC